ncbi:uncharacterized protein LOC131953330 isoform X2 [Physella acuta]|uniref:uncharacterized protein LOC131953330 isoform X2 n=1 Tax=Physella acuta TaxID=109671 RepID=UPI0027DCAB72|nr:uncharacterized protein LOC131953330 isoform X2 [Physella acuta]XP_059172457.1 uncharacterized protein LOC131953330 isoform X2 [Physella acuta]
MEDEINTRSSTRSRSSWPQTLDLLELDYLDESSLPENSQCVMHEKSFTIDEEMAATENRELVAMTEDSRNLLQHTEDSCSKVKEQGLVVGKYETLLDCFSEPTEPLLNGYFLHSVKFSKAKSISSLFKQLAERHNLCDINNSVIWKRFFATVFKLIKTVKQLRKNIISNWQRLVELFNTPFRFNKSNEKYTKKQNSLAVQSFFKCCVDPSSSAGKQMITNGESKYGLRIKPSCSKCPKINKELLQSKKTIKNLRQKLRCLPISLPRIQKLQEALLSTSRENEKLMSKLQEISDMHHNLLINVQLNNIEMEELKAENASLKAENKKLVEENTTMNEKLSTELILPFTFKMS